MLEAVEFQSEVKNGSIEIPDIHQGDLVEGAQVKVIVLKPSQAELIKEFKTLLKETQSLPQVQAITDAEIADEISAYREGL